MADRGLDLSAHRSRELDDDMLRQADLVIAMARVHVREAAVLLPEALPQDLHAEGAGSRCRRGRGARRRRAASTRGSAASPTHGVPASCSASVTTTTSTSPTPSAASRADYEVTADLLDRLLGEVVDLAFPVRSRAEGQRA